MANIKTPVLHGVVTVVLFGLPLVLMSNASWLNLTIGGVLTAVYHLALTFKK